jgi:hypothetical protein
MTSYAIWSKKVLVVEGKDECGLVYKMLKDMGIVDVQIINVEGNERFRTELPVLAKCTGFNDINVLGIIRDAERGAKSAFLSIINILKRLEDMQLTLPTRTNEFAKGNPRVGVFIIPGRAETGMIEDLCLRTVADHEAMKCVNSFVDCISKLDEPPKNISKAKAQAFLAAMPDLAQTVRDGANKGYWDMNSKEFADIKSFLTHLA